MKRSFRQIVKPIQTVLRKFFRPSSNINVQPNTKEQQILQDYFEGRIPLTEDVINMFSVTNTDHVQALSKHLLRGNPKVITLFLRALEKDQTNPHLIEGLSIACTIDNAVFPLEEVIAGYTKACELEKDINRFDEFAGFFYNTLKPIGFDALSVLKNNPNLSKEKQACLDRRLVYRTDKPNDL